MPLDPTYYFCTSCATPYKDEESVLPGARPVRATEGVLIAARAPLVAPVFWVFFAAVIASDIAAWLVFDEKRPDLRLVLETAILTLVTCIVGTRYWRSLLPQLKRFGLASPVTLVALVLMAPLLACNFVYHGFLFETLRVEEALPLDRLRASGIGETSLVVLFCVVPALIEEIAFRGLLQHWLQVAIRPWRAIVIASALFTLMHLTVLSAPYLFAVGCLLGWVKWRTGSLYPSMLLHFLHNLVVIEFFRPGT